MSLDYWIESVASSLDEHGVTVTKEQLESIAEDMMLSAEGESFYSGVQESTKDICSFECKKCMEHKKIIEELEHRKKCEKCNGLGYVQQFGPHHRAISSCFHCNGKGWI